MNLPKGIHSAKEHIEFVLRNQCQERKECATPIDSQEDEVYANDTSATPKQFERNGKIARDEGDEGDDTYQQDRPRNAPRVRRPDRKDEACFDSSANND
jgi:hypothetical protein